LSRTLVRVLVARAALGTRGPKPFAFCGRRCCGFETKLKIAVARLDTR
jgi:hypothetical protein